MCSRINCCEARGCIRADEYRRPARQRDRVREGDRGSWQRDPVLCKGSREELRAATGDTKLPALKLADGTMIAHSKAILSWVADQP
jgi:hypothetical protein